MVNNVQIEAFVRKRAVLKCRVFCGFGKACEEEEK